MRDIKDNINSIKEVYPGVYSITLNFASNNIIQHILSDNYKYVWVNNYQPPQANNWTNSFIPLFGHSDGINTLNRRLKLEFAMPTKDFRAVIAKMSNGLTVIQINKLPPEYLDIERLQGKTLFQLLEKECDYLFYLNIPEPIDYGTLISSNLKFLQDVLENTALNWNDLP